MRRSSRPQKRAVKYENNSVDDEEEAEELDFVDSGSEASIPKESDESEHSSGEDFIQSPEPKHSKKSAIKVKSIKKPIIKKTPKRVIFPKLDVPTIQETPFSVKDLTEAEKKLPEFLNLSESDTDDECDESHSTTIKSENTSFQTDLQADDSIFTKTEVDKSNQGIKSTSNNVSRLSGSDTDSEMEDVDETDDAPPKKEIATKLNFQQLQENTARLEEAKRNLETYSKRQSTVKKKAIDVETLLAMGESEKPTTSIKEDLDSDSDLEDLEEVDEASKSRHVIPKEGIQITLNAPDGMKQKKKIDIEMMMKRRINRVKKEYQVYMHKVHVLSWIAHGNHVNKILNHESVMGSALSLIPSEHCYPSSRVNIKYLQQIAKWFNETLDVLPDKIKRPKLSKIPLNLLLLEQISKKLTNSKKNKVFIFVSLLRALGLNCRLMLSFRVVPLHPPASELCSLSTKPKDDAKSKESKSKKVKPKLKDKIPQLDGADDLPKNKKGKKPAKSKNPVKIDKDKPSTSKESYWDKITRGTIDNGEKSERRVSHRDLNKSKQNTSKFFNSSAESLQSPKISTSKSKSAEKNTESVRNSSRKKPADDSSTKLRQSQRKSNKNTDKSNTSKYFETSVPEKSRKRKPAQKSVVELSDDEPQPKSSKRKASESSDADFKPIKRRSSIKNDKIDRRVLSSDDEAEDTKKKDGVDFWCEVYVEEIQRWISVDVIRGEVDCCPKIYKKSSHPVTYIVSWDTSGHVKDVTRRYVDHWNTITRRLRTDPAWYMDAIKPWMAPEHLRDVREDQELDRLQLDAPMPQTIFEFKNHPLYALKRHLLKFEVIYPPDAAVLGFVKNEAVYARECIYTCRSRDTWLKEAKVVKPGQQPYKIVKARPKYDRLSGKMITDLPLEVFGIWQTEDYVPPKAENGKVPRNAYGNVELFKPTMLPEGTVHLNLPGLNKVAKKLGIDCAPAMTGFDHHSGYAHPVYDGFVVCEEFKETIVEAWEQEQEEAERRARDKIETRVYGNWKRLIRGLLIREKLQAKYDFKSQSTSKATDITKTKKRTTDVDRTAKKRKVNNK